MIAKCNDVKNCEMWLVEINNYDDSKYGNWG